MSQLIECIPNFSEGRDSAVIEQIAEAIRSVEGTTLLEVDAGVDANRTVMTFVGHPAAVVESAFRAIKVAQELIDMRTHEGAHPRLGSTDVCPLVPLSNISLKEVVRLSRELAQRVGKELGVPVYLYECSATSASRRNLAHIRSGEYEGLAEKMQDPLWLPDAGPSSFQEKVGATVMGARDFLIAYNVNLATNSVALATEIAQEVRESGKLLRNEQGELLRNSAGQPVRKFGSLKSVKAIGWYMPSFHCAQVSTNLTNIRVTPLHVAYQEIKQAAQRKGVAVTGSELVGLVPLETVLQAGRYAWRLGSKTTHAPSEAELVQAAIQFLGLSELKPFDPNQKIIEYAMNQD